MKYLKIKTVAKEFGVSTSAIYARVKSGAIKVVEFDGVKFIKRSELDKWRPAICRDFNNLKRK